MDAFINMLVRGISTMFRFDVEHNPQQARKRSLIILLIIIVLLNVWVFASLLR